MQLARYNLASTSGTLTSDRMSNYQRVGSIGVAVIFTGVLSTDQLSRVHETRDEWMRIGLSTERCNQGKAEVAVRAAYRSAGFAEPRFVVWMDSPLGGCLASAVLRNSQLGGQLGGQLDPWYESYWMALYSLAFPLAELQVPERLSALVSATREIGWWWPLRDSAVLTDRPTVLAHDPMGRLHHATGPALAYADGFDGYWWHGVRVPADLIAGDGWDVPRILSERNTEIRRCAIERVGWDRFIAQSEMKAVSKPVMDPGNPGQHLLLFDLPPALAGMYGERARILLCTNGTVERDGTRRRFGLVVPAHHTDPVAAAADLYDMPVTAYRELEVRR